MHVILSVFRMYVSEPKTRTKVTNWLLQMLLGPSPGDIGSFLLDYL